MMNQNTMTIVAQALAHTMFMKKCTLLDTRIEGSLNEAFDNEKISQGRSQRIIDKFGQLMMNEGDTMTQYKYEGPVMMFDKVISHNWVDETYAISEKRARVNLMYRYNKEHKQIASTRISLPGKIIVVED